MKKIARLEKLSEESFKRLVGVKKKTYKEMLSIYKKDREKKEKKFGQGGRKRALEKDEEVLLMLGYYREYRTLKQIGFDYGVSEATASRIVKEVEEVLIKSGKFSLSKKKELYKDSSDTKYVSIDVTEIEIQRPKKDRNLTIQEKRKNIQ